MTGNTPTTPENRDPAVEIALLRAALAQFVTSLKRYHDAGHYEIENDDDGTPLFELVVPEGVREKASDAIARAEALLQDNERGNAR